MRGGWGMGTGEEGEGELNCLHDGIDATKPNRSTC